MHPEIAKLSSMIFYDDKVLTGIDAKSRSINKNYEWCDDTIPMVFYNTKGIELQMNGKSFYNQNEACIVEDIVLNLVSCGVEK